MAMPEEEIVRCRGACITVHSPQTLCLPPDGIGSSLLSFPRRDGTPHPPGAAKMPVHHRFLLAVRSAISWQPEAV